MPTEAMDTGGVIRMVLGVARLGENDLRGWWQGHALDRTGRYVLSGMFARTWRPAALELDLNATARLHDAMLGRTDALHLFSDRLPFRRWTIAWLAEQKTASEHDPLLKELETWELATAVETMRIWCCADERGPAGEALGAGLLLGRLAASELDDPAKIEGIGRLLGSAYIHQTGPLRPPYIDLVP